MKSRILVTGLLTAAMLSASIVPASAHDFHHGWGHGGYAHGGHDGGLLFGLIGGAVVAVATIATLPVRVVADAVSEPEPAPQQVYAAQAPAYYEQGGYYAARPRQVVYAYPQAAYPQAYAYPAAPAYYYPGY